MKKEKEILPTRANLGGGLLESNRKKPGLEKKILLSIGIVFILTLVIGISYAYIAYYAKQQTTNVIKSGCISIEMEELTNAINLKNAYPLTDEVGEKTKPFQFRITNTCNRSVDYSVNLEVLKPTGSSEETIKSSDIAAKIDEEAKKVLNTYPAGTITYNEADYESYESRSLTTGVLNVGESKEHKVRIWIDKDASNDSQNKNFYSKVVIEAIQNEIVEYQEEILNGADPVLKDGLIPVEIDNTGKVTKANVLSKWYSYEEKKWANAVILEDESIKYQNGEEIPENNIESYFVWIPKYSYQLWDLGTYNGATNGKPTVSKAKEIEIVFGTDNTEDVEGVSCATPMTSGASGNCNVGEYMTPPAFISMNTNGLWVGKFETTGSTSNITIKPGVTPLSNLTVRAMFDTAYNYKRELYNSHMMKNTEWGAVAYLSHSKYGINKEVNINNNSNCITGYSAVVGTDQSSYPGTYGTDTSVTLPYNTETGYLASTTGNISGVYDMSGGAWEYMASYISGNIGSSGFSDVTNPIYSKYLDVYSTSSALTSYQYRILGDATGEMGPFYDYAVSSGNHYPHNSWYTDHSEFVDSDEPWFIRGGLNSNGVLAGQFVFYRFAGRSNLNFGFRLVLAI